MAVTKMSNKKKQQSYISIPSPMLGDISSSSLESLLISPKKKTPSSSRLASLVKTPRFWLLLVLIFGFLGMLKMFSSFDHLYAPVSQTPCGVSSQGHVFSSKGQSKNQHQHVRMSSKRLLPKQGKGVSDISELTKISGHLGLQQNSFAALKVKMGGDGGDIDVESGFWKQPDGLGYRPCLEFSEEYRKQSEVIVKDRVKYLMVVVAGGINQQRNQIVDAVVIARILGAALVVPNLQVNAIWGDESEFSDIFDLDHFKKVLESDVRIVSSLPSTHLMTRPVEEKHVPINMTPQWIRSHYVRKMRREGVLLLRGLDSRLSKDLPSDLQKLRCKVAFHALRFAPPIMELGNKLTERMRSKGPYLALHLRMEKDVWVRTGCLPGFNSELDEIVIKERKQKPELLTSRSNMTFHERKLAGLCPLNAIEVARLLKALGAPQSARIYWAGGNPLGGKDALKPLITQFPHFYNKEDLALPGELEPFAKKASVMAAIDYVVSENSNVFMPSHGGNMGRALQGHRAYAGHKKTITPNKRQMLPHFLNSLLSETEFNKIIMDLHQESMGQPELRSNKAGRDVTKYPVNACMCSTSLGQKQ